MATQLADGDFAVQVLNAWNQPQYAYATRQGDYVVIPDGTEYKLRLFNNGAVNADAVVSIDGKEVGRWRVYPGLPATIERPAEIEQKFTFVAEGSPLARRAGVQTGREANGVVSVRFLPERRQVLYSMNRLSPSRPESFGLTAQTAPLGSVQRRAASPRQLQGARSGATILGEHSNQRFSDVQSIRDIDWDRARTITFRLIAEAPAIPNYQAIGNLSPRQLSPRRSLPPPRIDQYDSWANPRPWW